MIRPFLVALQFLTRIPVRTNDQYSDQDIGNSLLYYPLVGFIIGLLLFSSGWMLNESPPLVIAALVLTIWVVLTGGLHLDGLADSADAWIGGMGSQEKTLLIMKDPNCGPAGIVAIILVLLLKFTALHTLSITGNWSALLFTLILSRAMLPLLLLTTAYVRTDGLGATLSKYQPRRMSKLVIATTIILVMIAGGFDSILLIITTLITFLLLRFLMLCRIGGTTGDTAGALVEICETILLLVVVLG